MTHAANLTFAFKLRTIERATLVQCVFQHREDYDAVCNWIQRYIADQGSAANIKYSTAKEKSPESQSQQQQRKPSPAYQQPNALAGPSRIPAFSPQQHQQNFNYVQPGQQIMPDPISRRVPLVQPAQRQISPDPSIPTYVAQMNHLPSYSQPHHAQHSFIQPSQYATHYRPSARPAAPRNAYNNVAALSTALNASSQRPLHIPLPPKNRGDDTLAEIAEQAQSDALRGKNDKQAKKNAPATAAKKKGAGKKRARDDEEASSQATMIEESQTLHQHLYTHTQRSVASIPAVMNTAKKGKGLGTGRKATAKRSTPLPRLQEEDEEDTSAIPYISSHPAILSPYSPAVYQTQQRATTLLSPNLPSLTQVPQTSKPDSAHQQIVQEETAALEVDEEEDEAFLRRMRESLNKRNGCLPDKRAGSSIESTSAEVALAISDQSQTQYLSTNNRDDVQHASVPLDKRRESSSISSLSHAIQQRREEAPPPSSGTVTEASQTQQYSSAPLRRPQSRSFPHARSGIISSQEDSFNPSDLLAKRRRTTDVSICRATPESLESSPSAIPASSDVPMPMAEEQQQQPREPHIVNMNTFDLWQALEAKLTKQEMLDLSREVVLGQEFKGRCLDVDSNVELLVLGSSYLRED